MRIIKIYILFAYLLGFSVSMKANCTYAIEEYEEDTFIALMDSVKTHVSDSLIVDYVLLMDFYKEASSSAEEYAYLFRYCLEHHLEECDEAITMNLYEMFKSYPEKFQELDKYLNIIPKDLKERIKFDLMGCVAFALYVTDPDANTYPQFETLITLFPYFNESYLHFLYDTKIMR